MSAEQSYQATTAPLRLSVLMDGRYLLQADVPLDTNFPSGGQVGGGLPFESSRCAYTSYWGSAREDDRASCQAMIAPLMPSETITGEPCSDGWVQTVLQDGESHRYRAVDGVGPGQTHVAKTSLSRRLAIPLQSRSEPP